MGGPQDALASASENPGNSLRQPSNLQPLSLLLVEDDRGDALLVEELIADAARRVVELGWVKPGQRIGITAGLPSGTPGTTSLFQVQTV